MPKGFFEGFFEGASDEFDKGQRAKERADLYRENNIATAKRAKAQQKADFDRQVRLKEMDIEERQRVESLKIEKTAKQQAAVASFANRIAQGEDATKVMVEAIEAEGPSVVSTLKPLIASFRETDPTYKLKQAKQKENIEREIAEDNYTQMLRRNSYDAVTPEAETLDIDSIPRTDAVIPTYEGDEGFVSDELPADLPEATEPTEKRREMFFGGKTVEEVAPDPRDRRPFSEMRDIYKEKSFDKELSGQNSMRMAESLYKQVVDNPQTFTGAEFLYKTYGQNLFEKAGQWSGVLDEEGYSADERENIQEFLTNLQILQIEAAPLITGDTSRFTDQDAERIRKAVEGQIKLSNLLGSDAGLKGGLRALHRTGEFHKDFSKAQSLTDSVNPNINIMDYIDSDTPALNFERQKPLDATKPLADKTAETKPSGPTPPKKGEVRNGYKFLGGSPADKNNWEKQ